MSLSLERKVSFFALLALILALSVIVTLFNITNKSTIIENERNILSLQADRQIAYLEQEFTRIKQDISFLANSPYLSSFVNKSDVNNSVTRLKTSDKKILEEEFSRLILTRDAYTQIRLIGVEDGGRELVRINKNNSLAEVVLPADMQKKGHYPYFYEALKLSDKQFYISEVEYNRDFGVIESNNNPVIRLSRPIFTDEQIPFGVLVINVDFTKPLKHLSSHLNEKEHFVIRLPNGNYIFHIFDGILSDNQDRLVNEVGIAKGVARNKLPDFFQEHDKIHKTGEINTKKIVVHKHLELTKGKGLTLYLGEEIDQLNIGYFSFLTDKKYLSLPILLIVVIAAVMFSVLPLKQLNVLTNVIKGIANGTRKRTELPIDARNEIGDLSRSFNLLLDKVEKKEKDLELANEQLQLAIRGASDGIWDWNVVENEFDVSNRYLEMLGYEKGEINVDYAGLKNLIHPGDVARLEKFTQLYFDKKESKYEIEFRMKHKEGYYIDVLSRGKEIRDESGEVLRIVGTNTDVTERKRELSRQIVFEQMQKNSLVKEVHHRIKNNLQGVASLLRQHSDQTQEYKGELDTAISQVYTMAMVHGIQGKENDGSIYIDEMIREIMGITQDISGVKIDLKGANNHCKYRIEEKEAVPMALVFNELITNACKHSIDKKKITINMVCNWCNEELLSVVITNQSNELPHGFNLSEKSGLGTGLNLVMSLMPPEGAELKIQEENGVCYTRMVLAEPVIFLESDWEYLKVKQA